MQTVVDSEFWRYYLQQNYDEFAGLTPHQQVISNTENVFSEKQIFDLEIHLNEGVCFDSENRRYTLPEYIACRNDEKIIDIETHLEIEYERWKGDKKAEFERMAYVRDIENYQWLKKTGGESKVVVTEFDVLLDSIIERFNIKTQEWERYYEGKVRYLKYGKPVLKDFKLEPKQTHSADEFSKAMWELDFLEVKNMKNEEVRNFWFHIDMYWKPRIVREFNHFGFVTFEKKNYFMAGNVLVKFPENQKESLKLIAEHEGAFPVGNNKYITPPDDAVHLPYLDVGVSDPKTGLYKKKMSMLLNDETFERKFKEVEEHFCSMVGDDSEFREWGKLLLAYVFSYFFLDDIYGHFKHVIFMYLYGEGNVGKGEVAKRMLDFFGINYLASLNTPKARTVDDALEQNSAIIVWIDEHVPEIPGKQDVNINDQVWNSWFELKPRTTNIRKGVSWGIERKEVRTMPLFCSNFKPKTDHLLSRSLILEYRKDVRGPEKHVRWLANQKELLQLLSLSFMQHYNTMNREVFVWDLDRIRNNLKDDVKADLKARNVDAILQDRQISQFATLLTVYHWINVSYREEIQIVASKNRNLEEEENETHKELLNEEIQSELNELLDTNLYEFVKNEIVKSAVIASRHDPLTDYIETIGTLIQAGKITNKHFSWTKEGHLKIWAKAVWDEYENAKRGTDSIVRRDTVEEKLKNVSDLGKDGDLKTVNWRNDNDTKPTRCKGFYIENAVKRELLRINFNYERFRPSSAPSYYANDGQDDEIETPNLEEDAPF